MAWGQTLSLKLKSHQIEPKPLIKQTNRPGPHQIEFCRNEQLCRLSKASFILRLWVISGLSSLKFKSCQIEPNPLNKQTNWPGPHQIKFCRNEPLCRLSKASFILRLLSDQWLEGKSKLSTRNLTLNIKTMVMKSTLAKIQNYCWFLLLYSRVFLQRQKQIVNYYVKKFVKESQ